MLLVFYLISVLVGGAVYIYNVPLDTSRRDFIFVIGAILESTVSIVMLVYAGHTFAEVEFTTLSHSWTMTNFWCIYVAQWAHVGVVSLWCNKNLRGAIGRGISYSLDRLSKLV
jgi:hypothetical protein